ncbi:MAG: 30S ribosomal protein S16 [Candidatus Nomurabacteria bacterium]|jgi:small subunit ribosomal protein S16|nr:30S ribosomal protein S16 [Candidatus Nomurabacteria bacterium]
MLAIRLKRYGKTHFATYRLVIQDAAKHPSSGKVVAYVGNYNPHTKEVNLDKEQIEKYLSNGAQPSPRVVKLLKDAKVKLPAWVKEPSPNKARTTRNPDKLRKNRPVEEVVKEVVKETEPAVEVAETETKAEAPVEEAPVAETTETTEPVETETTAEPVKETEVEEAAATPAE